MNYNETPNMVIDNVFTDREIEQIYESLEHSSGHEFISVHSQKNTFINLPDNIIDKVTNYAKNISGNNNLVLTEYCHSTYQNVEKDGKIYRPSLFPHYDETFKEPRFTFDYQLKANIDWAIISEPDIELVLKDNQAATFAGTHQIHWRKPQIFENDQSVEMVFFHFSDPTLPPKTTEENKVIMEKAKKYKEDFLNNGGFSNERI